MPVEPRKICTPISFITLKLFTQGASLPATAVNDKGENVIVSEEWDEYGKCYRLDTYQNNGWVRINRYYPDGSWDEEYER